MLSDGISLMVQSGGHDERHEQSSFSDTQFDDEFDGAQPDNDTKASQVGGVDDLPQHVADHEEHPPSNEPGGEHQGLVGGNFL